jgi:putative ATPase
MDLFSNSSLNEPLASRLRPRTLDDFAGQEHIIGPGRLLRRSITADQLSSLIFYGPPGTGKTTLAKLIAGTTKSRFISMNAVLSGVAELRREIAAAKEAKELYNRRTILFIDEVHRWNKSQQDALLPWVENGTVILIGATTENPYFEVNKALVSRSRIFQLKPLEYKDLEKIAAYALNNRENGYGRWNVKFEEGALEHLIKVSAGDARTLLNAIELAVETTPPSFPPPEGSLINISLQAAEESIQQKALLYDKEGDYHFDTISAFIKAIRGSDPDAALYWLALMVKAGESPRFIFRRMLISASEDIGMADPQAVGIVESCAAAFERTGMPEGQYHLAHAALYLASAPKSNSILGYFDALNAVEESTPEVPNHLKDSSRDKHSFGHGEGYRYPHAYREHWNAQQYLPDALTGRIFYQPGKLGWEGKIREQILSRREEQLSFILERLQENQLEKAGEIYTYSPGDKQREEWSSRTEKNFEKSAVKIRNELFKHFSPARHWRILILADPGGTLIWQANRMVPEGGVTVLCSNPEKFDALNWMAMTLEKTERPLFINKGMADRESFRIIKEKQLDFEYDQTKNRTLPAY